MRARGRFLRSSLGGHNAGTGMEGYFDYKDYGYSPLRAPYAFRRSENRVTLPNEDPKRWAELSGPCVTVVEGKEKSPAATGDET